jgi:N utilization substance protein A
LIPSRTCVGVRGTRVNNVLNELLAKRVDIVRGVKPSTVVIGAATNVSSIVVDENSCHGCCGRRGKSRDFDRSQWSERFRLAAELTGWKINIATADESAQSRQASPIPAARLFMAKLVDEGNRRHLIS